MGKAKNKPPRNHHIIPEFYLKGFTETDYSPFLWVYTRGKEYKPGLKAGKYNPYKESVSKASVIRDFYMRTRPNGEKDFASFEMILAYKESQANPILAKLRRYETINIKEKRIFAEYISIMMKCVPKCMDTINDFWLSVVQDMKKSSEISTYLNMLGLNEYSDDQNINIIKQQYNEIIEQYKRDIPDDIRLGSMVDSIRLPSTLHSMVWQYFVAPDGLEYITSDNPVYFLEEVGLNKSYSEFVFPISKK